ncbi:RNA polymerase II C-terminal domain kinase beta subunit [Scheffersomyces spartinae]|uniref:RNA polymerase II C-terminal domain kinase beta subunit n=1 Tax=Scheffersomyces spartinae TaxID=45513 RepID=A0A9P7V7Z3_9ASCO|nr:RNA polymerase II C-terminal domain kinase beta subunit [Scheffersomyces spartinae]KAG7193060.1 RNA polymerase II C-terminal domain kinase beta subunit [Scheffersomyces spartinae]
MLYYQRWYLLNEFDDDWQEGTNDINDKKFDPYTVAMASLFLASKNEDCIKKLSDIQAVGNKLRDLDTGDKEQFILFQRKCILNIEFKMLQVIKFNFMSDTMVPSIDSLVVIFAKKLGIGYKNTMFSWLVTFDIMSTLLGIMIPPHCIALAIVIITLNFKPKQLSVNPLINVTKNTDDAADILSDDKLNAILESIDCMQDFKAPESLVNEAIIYVLNYYIHQMKYSILNEYIPRIDEESGKEQIFKFMDLKSKFNDLQVLDTWVSSHQKVLNEDGYLKTWDYSTAQKGSVRFLQSNKRRRFALELKVPGKPENV